MTEGYEVREIHYTQKTCFGCDFYDHIMMKSGRHPEYRDACKHPQAIIDYYGNKSSLPDREICGHDAPFWCPVGVRVAKLRDNKDGEQE